MKMTLFLISSIFLTLNSLAKDIVDGYYITLNHDTLKCQLKVNSGLDVNSKIIILDSAQNEIAYKSSRKEILGFGFIYKNHKYDYLLKSDEHEDAKFYEVVERGKNFSLYSFSYYAGSGMGASYRVDYYIIEDSTGKEQSLHGGLGSGFRKKMIKFLNNDQTLLKLYDKIIYSISDLPKFVNAANKI